MDVSIIFKIAAVGIMISILNLILKKADRDEQAMLTTLTGLVVVLFWVLQYISDLFEEVRTLFEL